jgi:hypothetical protein
LFIGLFSSFVHIHCADIPGDFDFHVGVVLTAQSSLSQVAAPSELPLSFLGEDGVSMRIDAVAAKE